MIYFWILVMAAIVFYVTYLCFKFRNPYKLIMIFGKKGSGKTTLLTKIAVKNIRKGKTVYSTFYVPGVCMFDVQDIGQFQFQKDSVIIIDEVGMIWDNRNFKAFRMDVRDWFKLQRQYRNTVYLASQTFDIDVKLRNLTDQMFLCTCKMGWLSVARKIKRSITLVQPMGDSESRIADQLEFEPILWSLFGANTIIFTFIPAWTKVFKSFNPKELPEIQYEFMDIPRNLYKFYNIKADVEDDPDLMKPRYVSPYVQYKQKEAE